jgi:hypothetical protein
MTRGYQMTPERAGYVTGADKSYFHALVSFFDWHLDELAVQAVVLISRALANSENERAPNRPART